MPLPAPVVILARKKAALTMHHGPDDERTLAVASQLRVARMLAEIESGLSAQERAELTALLSAL